MIREGFVGPGERLPPQRDLAARFGVGLSSVREAVRSLASLGILETRQGRGVFVKHITTADVTRVARGILSLTPEAALQLLEARAMIEIGCAQLAAVRRTPADLDAMARSIDSTRQAVIANNIDSLVLSDMDFHVALVDAAHNDVASVMLASVGGFLRVHLGELYRRRRGSRTVVGEHQQIHAAIEAKDSERAGRLIEAHLAHARQRILGAQAGP